MRFFAYTLQDESMPMPQLDEAGMQAMNDLVVESMAEGVILATGGLAPTADGFKITLSDGEFSVTDGPFAEAKELVGGWALMEVRDREEAIERTKRYLSIVGQGESRVRQVFGPE